METKLRDSRGDEPKVEMATRDNRREELADVKTCETMKQPTGEACALSSSLEEIGPSV